MIHRPHVKLLLAALLALASAFQMQAGCRPPALNPLTPIPAEHDVAEFEAGDVDGDGQYDLITVSTTAETIHVRLGNGDGTFGDKLVYTAPDPTEIALGDLNGDDFLDLVIASEPAQTPTCVSFGSCAGVSVLLNDGDGTFGAATTTPVPYAASIAGVDTADFDGDGEIDVLVAAPPLTGGDPAIHVFFGNGAGGFTSEHSWGVDGALLDAIGVKLTAGTEETDVVALVTPGASSTTTRVISYASQGGTFPAISATRGINTATGSIGHLTTADFNGDGTIDIGLSYRYSSSFDTWAVAVVTTNGPGTLNSGGESSGSNSPITGIAAEDVDEDGDADVMVAEGTSFWKVYRRDFPVETTAQEDLGAGAILTRVLTRDFNFDVRPDFFYLDTGTDMVRILENTCTSRFVKVTLSSSPNPSVLGSDATFTITVEPKPGAPMPSGPVALYDGNTKIAEGTLNGNGNAFITLSDLSAGTHSMKGQFVNTSTLSDAYLHTVALPPFGPPPNLTATGNAAASKITIRWTPTAETASYDILRRSNGGWLPIGNTTADSFNDVNVSSSAAYVYAVRARRTTTDEISADSNSDIGTTAILLLPGDHQIRAADFTSTRTLVDSLRSAAGLPAFPFTDASLSGVPVKAVHMTELRTALNQARMAHGFAALTFTNPTITPNTTPIRAVDIQELRDSLQ